MSKVRSPAVAGTFYPAPPARLAAMVEGFLAAAQEPPVAPSAPVRALIAPHAGYPYSGPTAGHAFAALRHADRFTRVVVIGPSHFVAFRGLAGPPAEAFRTPLGDVPLDTAMLMRLAALPQVELCDRPHQDEHAIEVELPFLQHLIPDLRLVPLLVGRAEADEVAEVLAACWDDTALLVVSSDLSHYEPYASAQRHDARTAAAIEALDPGALHGEDACGHLAIVGLLREARRRGLGAVRRDLRNSGDTAGRKDHVVGYGAWAFS